MADWLIYGANGYTTAAQANLLAQRLDLGPGKRLLDVGSGRGWPGLYLAASTGCTVVLTDLLLLAVARRRLHALALVPEDTGYQVAIDSTVVGELPTTLGHAVVARLLFLHWTVPADELQPLLPKGLELDTHDGQAWVGLVPFVVIGARPVFLPPVPGVSTFDEINVRFLQLFNKLPRVRRHAVEKAALAFGEEDVECNG